MQIDECLFGHRKYQVGRIVKPDWFFGICESAKGGRVYIERVTARNRATLVPIVHQKVDPGSTIMSDEWKASANLYSEGFIH